MTGAWGSVSLQALFGSQPSLIEGLPPHFPISKAVCPCLLAGLRHVSRPCMAAGSRHVSRPCNASRVMACEQALRTGRVKACEQALHAGREGQGM